MPVTQILCVDISKLERSDYEALYFQASAERRTRADRYPKWEDKLRCVAADGLLRYALGTDRYTEVRKGCAKPFIQDRPDFHYNLSHSGSWVVLAYGDREVGIDVEQIRMDAGKEKLARRYFTEKEQAYVFRSEEDRDRRFFAIWTAKESYLKYLGTGLQKALNSFCVLSMAKPRFFTQGLGDCCMTLCAEEEGYSIETVTAARLCKTPESRQ